jgi:serine/threonine protein kinase
VPTTAHCDRCKLTPKQRLELFVPVCQAIQHAHQKGIIHRDIKPSNVLVALYDDRPVVKVIDFGVAKATGTALTEETIDTGLGGVVGTPEYMSPEQALGKRGDEIDGRSDLYSLGVVMYRMLTGELPFKAETTVEMILQHLRTPPVPPHLAKPELAIPEAVSAVVMKALEKDREKRFATGAEMAAAFKKARGSTTLHSRKIDWKALSSASASFGAEIPASGTSSIGSTSSTHQTPSTPTSTTKRLAESTIYRTSARIGPPPREFPTRMVATVAAAVLLIGGVWFGWKHFASSTPAVKPAPVPVVSTVPPLPKENKSAVISKTPPPVAPTEGQKEPPEHRKLTFDEQAKVIELDSRADIDYNQGGCEKALATYQQVLEIDPNDARAYAAVQKCYAKARSGESIDPATPPETSPHQ